MRDGCLCLDANVVCSDGTVRAHKVVLVAHSPYIRALLTSEMAESLAKSLSVSLPDAEVRTVEAIIGCVYTGKLALSGATVCAVLKLANMLQIAAIEQAAAAFFVRRLCTDTALSALRFAEQMTVAGDHGKILHQQCLRYVHDNFPACSLSDDFNALTADELAPLLGSGKLVAKETEVLDALRRWFTSDAESRKAALPRLLPLVRFPRIVVEAPDRDVALLELHSEPLLLAAPGPAAALGLLRECLPAFAASADAPGCVRLQPRRGVRFVTVWSRTHKDDGIDLIDSDLVARNSCRNKSVWSEDTLPSTGCHYWEVTMDYPGKSKGQLLGGAYFVGVTNTSTPRGTSAYNISDTWGLTDTHSGRRSLRVNVQGVLDRAQQEPCVPNNSQGMTYGSGDRVGILADMDARPRTLQFFRDGQRLEGAVVAGFPEVVRIVASPFNTGVTATLAFPAPTNLTPNETSRLSA
jgi:hypothetical protein